MSLISIGFTLDDIKGGWFKKGMTVPQVNMYLQRHQEPEYKQQIERELNKDK